MTTEEFDDSIYRETFPDVCATTANGVKKCCSLSTLTGFFPVLKWLPKYQLKFIIPDVVAGLTVGLTTVPQAIAYGTVAGLPPQYGLYSAFMGCFVYIVFGSCKDITVGPTAIMSLMVQKHVAASPDFAVLSCFLSGCVIFAMGLLNLGVLVQFISAPVTTGFTTAAAITIASGQINSLFGIPSPSNEFVASWVNFFTNLEKTSLNDSLLGVGTLIFLLLMRKVRDLKFLWKTLAKYIALSRNILAVVVGILLCYYLADGDKLPFRVSGEITPGIPDFQAPPFSTTVEGEELNFGDMMSVLSTSVITIPIISILESVAIAKSFSKGKIVDATQEMIALGMCNFWSSFFRSMPITGSFTRSAINNTSGVKTQLGGAVTGFLVLMSLAWLTTTFYYIPKATLSAIIIAAMIFMIEYDRIAEIWRSKKSDFFVYIVTVICCLFWSLEMGIVCGIGVNLLFILYKSARPKISLSQEKINGNEIAIVEVQENLGYSSAEYLKSKVIRYVNTQQNISYVVIKGEEILSIDSTVAFNIISLQTDLAMINCELICWNWNIAAAGVVCRLHQQARTLFKFGKTLPEIIDAGETQSLLNAVQTQS